MASAAVKHQMLNGWVATSSSAVVVTAYQAMITHHTHTRGLDVRI